MLAKVASRVSLRSRERKLRLFLDVLAPGPETTVVDVGVTDAPFAAGSPDNFFEALYPWPERVTAVGHTRLERCRVARRVFVTTPNRWFPLDPHTLLPFVHWLPAGPRRARLLRARGFDDVLDPLGPAELAALFPYPVRVLNHGMTLIAVGPR